MGNSDPPQRGRRIKELEVMVADTIQETYDTTTLVLFTGNDRLEYRAGHFVTVDPHQFEALARFTAYLEDVKGRREPPRAYSLASAPHERYLAITVKEERYVSGQTKYPPLLSPLLVRRTTRGTRMVITGFTGSYTLPIDVEDRADHILHVVAGSGAVPNLSIMKESLVTHRRLRHTFISSNRTLSDMLYSNTLAKLEREHADRVRVVHALTRAEHAEDLGPSIHPGRVTADLLRELVPDPTSCLAYVCGPAISSRDRKLARERGEEPTPRFIESVMGHLVVAGISGDRIMRESWG